MTVQGLLIRAAVPAGAILAGLPAAGSAAGAVGFAQPIFVSTSLAGGEPFVLQSSSAHDLVYTSHEGTTHIYRPALVSTGTADFAANYENHVNIWTSSDGGSTWTPRDEGAQYTGFSDPDLTQDSGGTVYDTGIDLANDALFSSADGGLTWPNGTAQCHEGDRPWLAGGRPGEVFLATDTEESGHEVFRSTDSGNTCGAGILDDTHAADGTHILGAGKLIYDPTDGSIIEPAAFVSPGSGAITGIGISRLAGADSAFDSGQGQFTPQEVVSGTSVYKVIGAAALARDQADNLYLTWDTDDRDTTSSTGCSTTQSTPGSPQIPPQNAAPLPNRIMLVVGRHTGQARWTWSAPVAIAHPASARVLWPWIVAGAAGRAAVVWYQYDRVVDPDCATTGDVRIMEASITGADDASTLRFDVIDAAGRVVHSGGICNSGTTCVATGQDRRLGDFFTDAIDSRGCVLIASGDTTMTDPLGGQLPTSRPIFIRQNSGPGLYGVNCGAPGIASAPSAGSARGAVAALPNTGGEVPAGGALLILLLLAPPLLLCSRRAPSDV